MVEAQRADIAVQRRGGGAHLALGDLLPLGVGGVLQLAHLVAELVDELQAMGADDQLVDQPAEMLAVDAEMRQRLLVGADAPHVLQPVVGGLAGEALGAVFQHARRRRRAAGLLAEDVGEDRAEIDGGAGRLRDLGRRLAVAAIGFVGGDARWRCGSRSRAAPNRRSAGRPSARRTAAAGCRRRARAARCAPGRASWRGNRRRRRCGSRPGGRPGDGSGLPAGRAPGRA